MKNTNEFINKVYNKFEEYNCYVQNYGELEIESTREFATKIFLFIAGGFVFSEENKELISHFEIVNDGLQDHIGDLEIEIKEWKLECKRLAALVDFWQKQYNETKPSFETPKIDNL